MGTGALKLGVQLYSLRSLDLPLDELLAEVAGAGYAGVETVGTHNVSADEMRTLLGKTGLAVCSTHVSLEKVQNELDAVIAFNKAVGNDVIVVPALPERMRGPDAEGWRAAGRTLRPIAERCAGEGMQLLFHNHWWEMEELEGKRAIDWLLQEGGPLLGFEPDLAWAQRGGVDPEALLMHYAGRCPRVHFKDLAREGESDNDLGLADVGHGVLAWEQLIPAAEAAGARWAVVEHDLPRDPLSSIRRSAAFLKERLG